MGKVISIFFIIVIISTSTLLYASTPTRIVTQNSNYNDTEYRVFLTMEQGSKTKNFDIDKLPLPKSLDEIIAVAQKQINKIDSKTLWEINNINIQISRYGNDRYWHYRIQFKSLNQYFTILVTIDGTPGEIIKIKEESLE